MHPSLSDAQSLPAFYVSEDSTGNGLCCSSSVLQRRAVGGEMLT